MTNFVEMEDVVYLAPLHGFTDYFFRNIYFKHFQGFDYAVSPFISLTHGTKITPKKVRDLAPENNKNIPIIPQVLGNEANLFVQLSKFLDYWGYKSLNWNLGCPIKGIVNKKRGSGLLPFPLEIRSILDIVVPKIPQKLSVKIRLGYHSTDEIYQMIPVLNDYPLEFVCIHPRIGTQMYEGNIHYDVFGKIINEFKAPLIYNGDISDIEGFRRLKTNYPVIKKWMIGRSVFYNPEIPSQIKGYLIPEKKTFFEEYIFELYNSLFTYKSENKAINKIKDYWFFIAKRYFDCNKALDIIIHSQTVKQIFDNTKNILYEFKPRF